MISYKHAICLLTNKTALNSFSRCFPFSAGNEVARSLHDAQLDMDCEDLLGEAYLRKTLRHKLANPINSVSIEIGRSEKERKKWANDFVTSMASRECEEGCKRREVEFVQQCKYKIIDFSSTAACCDPSGCHCRCYWSCYSKEEVQIAQAHMPPEDGWSECFGGLNSSQDIKRLVAKTRGDSSNEFYKKARETCREPKMLHKTHCDQDVCRSCYSFACKSTKTK